MDECCSPLSVTRYWSLNANSYSCCSPTGPVCNVAICSLTRPKSSRYSFVCTRFLGTAINGVTNVYSPWKTIPYWNLCFRQRLPPPPSNTFSIPWKSPPPLENLPSLLCALLTRDMFAIAKFLVHTPFPFNLYDHLEPCQSRASSVVAWSVVLVEHWPLTSHVVRPRQL